MTGSKKLDPTEQAALLDVLETRFETNRERHRDIEWARVRKALEEQPDKLWSLSEMERTGGEPDLVQHAQERDVYVFYDCSQESPVGRRSLCYDADARQARKANKPDGSATDMAMGMGIELLTDEQYRTLQLSGPFDQKTSSWVSTPRDIRELGGALFCDFRYGQVFTYHNGAQSYYAARGFRGLLRI